MRGIDWVFFRTYVLSATGLLLFAVMEADCLPCLVDTVAGCVLVLLELFYWRDTWLLALTSRLR